MGVRLCYCIVALGCSDVENQFPCPTCFWRRDLAWLGRLNDALSLPRPCKLAKRSGMESGLHGLPLLPFIEDKIDPLMPPQPKICIGRYL